MSCALRSGEAIGFRSLTFQEIGKAYAARRASVHAHDAFITIRDFGLLDRGMTTRRPQYDKATVLFATLLIVVAIQQGWSQSVPLAPNASWRSSQERPF